MPKRVRKDLIKIPCAFHWHQCIDPSVKAMHKCSLRKMECPYWVKRYLSEFCPFLGVELTPTERTIYERSGWKWKEED